MTIHDIAKQLGVSAATVSLALNGDRRVAAATRERVLAHVRACGFTINAQARNFRLRRTGNVALVVHNIDGDFWHGTVKAMEDALGDAYSVIICNSDGLRDKEARLFASLLRRKVDGIIVQPTTRDDAPYLAIQDAGVPIVLLEETPNPGLSFVKGDDYRGALSLTRSCIRHGHRSIALLTAAVDCLGLDQRLEGFLDAIRTHPVHHRIFTAPDLTEQAVQAAVGDSSLGDFSLWICTDDTLAALLMKRLLALGLRIPSDISLIGWNDCRFLDYLPIPLSSVRVPMADIARTAAHAILRSLAAGHPVTTRAHLPETLVRRSSYAPIRPTPFPEA